MISTKKIFFLMSFLLLIFFLGCFGSEKIYQEKIDKNNKVQLFSEYFAGINCLLVHKQSFDTTYHYLFGFRCDGSWDTDLKLSVFIGKKKDIKSYHYRGFDNHSNDNYYLDNKVINNTGNVIRPIPNDIKKLLLLGLEKENYPCKNEKKEELKEIIGFIETEGSNL